MRFLDGKLWFLPPGGEPVDYVTYAAAQARACGFPPIVAHTTLCGDAEPARVSTVFLDTDHGWGLTGVPILWETMVFGPVLDCEQWRYVSAEEASEGHLFAVSLVRSALDAWGEPARAVVTYRGRWWAG